VATKKEQNLWERIFHVNIDRDRIAGWDKELGSAIESFRVRLYNSS
jgi:hypothetical protein